MGDDIIFQYVYVYGYSLMMGNTSVESQTAQEGGRGVAAELCGTFRTVSEVGGGAR